MTETSPDQLTASDERYDESLDDSLQDALDDRSYIAEADLGFAHPLRDLIGGLAENGQTSAAGLSGTYAAATLSQLSNRLELPLVIITADWADAQQMGTDLCAFGLGSVGREVLVLPPPDVSPWGDVSPDRHRIMARLNGQFRLAMGDAVRAVVFPVEAALRKVVPWAVIEDASTMLSVGDTDVDLNELRRVLTEGGYASVKLVEDPGTFAIRGGLLDVFSPYETHPVRIDLFGDEIESIRLFDPQTQRTYETRQDIFIFPVREEILSSKTLATARERLRGLGDLLQLPSRQITQRLQDLESGYNFFGIESLLPALFDLVPLLSLLPADSLWVAVEDADLRETADKIWARRQVECERAKKDGELAFETADFYVSPKSVIKALAAKEPLVRLGTLALSDGALTADDDKLTFRVHRNEDVVRLRRSHDESEGTVHALVGLINRWRPVYGRIGFACRSPGSAERLSKLLRAYGQRVEMHSGVIDVDDVQPAPAEILDIYVTECAAGFRSPALSLALVTDAEIFGKGGRRRQGSKRVVEEAMVIGHFRELSPGDLVVHLDFGIARYHGMEKLEHNGVAADYLKLEFAGEDKLYLPVHRLRKVHKYVGGDNASGQLDKIGGVRWANSKTRVRQELELIADELLRVYAERKTREGFAFPPPDQYFHEFEAEFPFEETPHQETAIDEIVADMVAPRPMDRLLCGDVGFGKTEVAMRASFVALLGGRQVAVLVPTTILAEQHQRTFSERMRNFPVRIETVSRFRTPQQIREILADTAAGKVDILIGTHRLLSKDVEFRKLGLLVVDEEQRFGVKHKEKIKALRSMVDVLTMSATPIPRTLEMSLLGIRDLSVILTPPNDRLSVRTHVAPFKESVIREGIENELRRGGQVFFVHNRVQGIEQIANNIREIVPEARVTVGHAQMSNSRLEKVMADFIAHKIDVLVCTTIVESGLDIVSANTIFINRADAFGLAQLYQLRGRVGRGRVRAFCYLLVSPRRKMHQDAARRLEVIRSHTELGSGITIAQHDLDIRGAGNILGENQSGHIRTIGYDLFCELLEETMRARRGQPVEKEVEPEVKIPVSAYLPHGFIGDEGLRLLSYKRLSMARNSDELADTVSELVDRFGRLPPEAANLIEILSIRNVLIELGVESIEAGAKAVVLKLSPECHLDPDKVVDLVARSQGSYTLRQDMTLIRRLGPKEGQDVLAASVLVVRQLRKRCLA